MATMIANRLGTRVKGIQQRQAASRQSAGGLVRLLAVSALSLGVSFFLAAAPASAQTGWVTGTVYRDVNFTATDVNDDQEINGVLVSIYTDPNGDNNPADGVFVDSTNTDNNGDFQFGVPYGEYVIVETDPPGHISVYDVDATNAAGDNPNVSPTDNWIPVTLGSWKPDDNNNYFVDRIDPGTPENVCYAVSDGTNHLYMIDYITANLTDIGNTNEPSVETIAIIPGDGGNFTLYAANNGTLGTLNVATGDFTDVGSFGGGFTDVDSLSWDVLNQSFWGVHRVPGSGGGDEDILFQINPLTGAGSGGVDVEIINFGGSNLGDVDDIAIDPNNGTIYAAINDGGAGGVLAMIDRLTGDVTVMGAFGVDDIEGLAFTPDGSLFGSTGDFGGGTAQSLYNINMATGVATLIAPFSTGTDYEALACLTYVEGESLVSISKSVEPSPIVSGQPLTYTITVLNDPTSTGAATGVTLMDVVPVAFNSVTVTPPGSSTCLPTSGVAGDLISCQLDNIPIGESTIVNIIGTAP